MRIKSDANKGQYRSEVIVRGKRNKQNRNWFYFNLSFESSSFIFNNFKMEKLKLTFEGWNRPVCNLFGFTSVFLSKLHFTLEQWSDAESPFPLFFSFSASFKNFSPREKVGNCLRFGTGGWSLCFYPLLSRNIWIFCPTLTMAARAKKKFLAKRFARAIRVHYRDLEHAYAYWIWLRGSASFVIITFCFERASAKAAYFDLSPAPLRFSPCFLWGGLIFL